MTPWLPVLKAFAALDGASRHPEDVCKRFPDALAHAHQLARNGALYRNPATGYFSITPTGSVMLDIMVQPENPS